MTVEQTTNLREAWQSTPDEKRYFVGLKAEGLWFGILADLNDGRLILNRFRPKGEVLQTEPFKIVKAGETDDWFYWPFNIRLDQTPGKTRKEFFGS